MKVIVITQPDEVDQEAEIIVKMLGCGVDRVHIRKPGWNKQQTKSLIEAIPNQLRVRLTLHDHFELCEDLGVGGVQLNSRNHVVSDGFSGVVSRSCHSLEEVADSSNLNYVTLSPIFDSISKSGYQSNFDADDLQGTLPANTIAMGGVTPEQIPYLWSLGFDGVAMIGSIWGGESVEEIEKRVQKAVKLAKMCSGFSLQYITHRNDKLNDIQGSELLLQGGGRWVQLRMKGFSDDEFLASGKALRDLCSANNAIFLINDRVDLVSKCGADGVHLGKNDMTPSDARKVLGNSVIIGGTANSCQDIDYLVDQGVDYIGLGPFRFTTTKDKLSPILGLEGYKTAVAHCKDSGYFVPIVAIGGIKVDDINSIMECGVNGVAISGTILNSDDVVKTTHDIVKILEDKIQ